MVNTELVLVGYLDQQGNYQRELTVEGQGAWFPVYIRRLIEVADVQPVPAPEAAPAPAETATRKTRTKA